MRITLPSPMWSGRRRRFRPLGPPWRPDPSPRRERLDSRAGPSDVAWVTDVAIADGTAYAGTLNGRFWAPWTTERPGSLLPWRANGSTRSSGARGPALCTPARPTSSMRQGTAGRRGGLVLSDVFLRGRGSGRSVDRLGRARGRGDREVGGLRVVRTVVSRKFAGQLKRVNCFRRASDLRTRLRRDCSAARTAVSPGPLPGHPWRFVSAVFGGEAALYVLGANPRALCRTVDSAQTWVLQPHILCYTASSRFPTASPARPRACSGASYQGLLKSRDSGATWAPVVGSANSEARLRSKASPRMPPRVWSSPETTGGCTAARIWECRGRPPIPDCGRRGSGRWPWIRATRRIYGPALTRGPASWGWGFSTPSTPASPGRRRVRSARGRSTSSPSTPRTPPGSSPETRRGSTNRATAACPGALRGLASTALYALAIDPESTERVFGGTAEGLFRSEDGGGTWSRTLTVTQSVYSPSSSTRGGPERSMPARTTTPSMATMATTRGAARSSSAATWGASFTKSEDLGSPGVCDRAGPFPRGRPVRWDLPPASPSSGDGGMHWQLGISNQLPPPRVGPSWPIPQGPDTCTRARGRGVFRTVDGAHTWEAFFGWPHVHERLDARDLPGRKSSACRDGRRRRLRRRPPRGSRLPVCSERHVLASRRQSIRPRSRGRPPKAKRDTNRARHTR